MAGVLLPFSLSRRPQTNPSADCFQYTGRNIRAGWGLGTRLTPLLFWVSVCSSAIKSFLLPSFFHYWCHQHEIMYHALLTSPQCKWQLDWELDNTTMINVQQCTYQSKRQKTVKDRYDMLLTEEGLQFLTSMSHEGRRAGKVWVYKPWGRRLVFTVKYWSILEFSLLSRTTFHSLKHITFKDRLDVIPRKHMIKKQLPVGGQKGRRNVKCFRWCVQSSKMLPLFKNVYPPRPWHTF